MFVLLALTKLFGKPLLCVIENERKYAFQNNLPRWKRLYYQGDGGLTVELVAHELALFFAENYLRLTFLIYVITDFCPTGFLNMDGWLTAEAEGDRGLGGDTEDEDLKKSFEEWKSKPYALTVPLRIVGLRGSVPPAWLKVYSLFPRYVTKSQTGWTVQTAAGQSCPFVSSFLCLSYRSF